MGALAAGAALDAATAGAEVGAWGWWSEIWLTTGAALEAGAAAEEATGAALMAGAADEAGAAGFKEGQRTGIMESKGARPNLQRSTQPGRWQLVQRMKQLGQRWRQLEPQCRQLAAQRR